MTNKKHGFWTFLFSLIPGAGEMYMGFFRHGISVMALFFLTICISAFINVGPLLFLLPIIWFYSFFHVHNLKNLPDEEFYAIEDDFLIPLKGSGYDVSTDALLRKYKIPLAVVLIILGASILWDNFTSLLGIFLPYEVLWPISSMVPQTVIGLLIVALGLYLIIGKKKQLDREQAGAAAEDSPKEETMDDFGYQKDAEAFLGLPVPEGSGNTEDETPSEPASGGPEKEE